MLRPREEFPSSGITHAHTHEHDTHEAKEHNTKWKNRTRIFIFTQGIQLRTEHVRYGRQLDPDYLQILATLIA